RKRTMSSSHRSRHSAHPQVPTNTLGTFCLALCILAIAASSHPASGAEAPNQIRIEYEPPKSDNYQNLADRLKANRTLEKMQEMFGSFLLPSGVTLRT